MKKFVDILTDFKHEDRQYFKGERRFEDLDDATYFCAAGWASDPTGELVTGEPDVAHKTLVVAPLKLGAASADLTIRTKKPAGKAGE